jgi:hypothetical protein
MIVAAVSDSLYVRSGKGLDCAAAGSLRAMIAGFAIISFGRDW